MSDKQFIVATNNRGKLDEIKNILQTVGYRCISLAQAKIDIEVEETGNTFAENARIKARAVYDVCRKPVIADDSGLCVDYLDGEPGVKTARYAGEDRDNEANIDKLLSELDGVPVEGRGARFVAAVCAITSDGREITAAGWCEGFIGTERRGNSGFGYDPVFWQHGNRSFAEIPDDKKNKISHRARALAKMAFKLRGISRIRSYD